MPALIAGTVIVGTAALGIGTLIRTIPASYTGVPADTVEAGTGVLPHDSIGSDNGNPPMSAVTHPATNRRANRAWCPECGVVESIAELEPSADIGEHGMAPANIDDDTTSDARDRAPVASARRFAMTVRLRDGTRTVFHESTARNWHPGVRVIVIAGGPSAERR